MIDVSTFTPTKEFQDATGLLADPEGLRLKAETDGYLFFRGLLPTDHLMEVRRQILEVLADEGLMDDSHALTEGVVHQSTLEKLVAASEIKTGVGITLDIYRKIQKLQDFHALAHEPALLHVFEVLFGSKPFPHPRNIARVIFPHPQIAATPPHQDFIHIQGTEETWTCWFPLGDVPRELGGLAILERSHKEGLLQVTGAQGAGNLESILCGLDLPWATIDYKAGDVLILHSYSVHKGLPNKMGDLVRLSCDFRYQPLHLEIEERSLRPHANYAWEDIYEGWTREDLKYYWQHYDLPKSPWDESVRWQKEKIC